MTRPILIVTGLLLTTLGASASIAVPRAINSTGTAAADSNGAAERVSGLLARALKLLEVGDAPGALALMTEAVKVSREVLGEQHPETLRSIHEYASALESLGRSTEAEPLAAQALRLRRNVLGRRHTETLASLHKYASILDSLGRTAEAEPLAAEALRLRREVLGERHPDTMSSLNLYAFMLEQLGRSAEAEPLTAQELRLRREVLGESHPDTLMSLNNYAMVLASLGRDTEAEPLYAEGLRLTREVLGEKHPTTVIMLGNYAGVLQRLGRQAESEPLVAEGLRLSREVFGERHPDTLASLNNYAHLLRSLGRLAEAEPLHAEELRLSREVLGERHPDTLTSLNNYAAILHSLGRVADAEPLYAEVLRLRREVLGEFHQDTVLSLRNYATVLDKLGREAEAEPLYAEALRLSREFLGERHPSTLTNLRRYALFLLANGQAAAALPLSRELAKASRDRAVNLVEDGLRGSEQLNRELRDRQDNEHLLADVLWANSAAANSASSDLQNEAFTTLELSSEGATTRAVATAAAARYASGIGLQQLVHERQTLAREWPVIEASLVKAQAGGDSTKEGREKSRTRLRTLEQRVHELDTRLTVEAPQYFSILNQQSVDLERLRGLMHEDEAVLFLVPTDRGTHSMVITRNSIRWNRAEKGLAELKAAVQNLRNGLEIRSGGILPEFDLQLAYQLYKDLIAPVEAGLEGISRVYVVAGGPFSSLPLGTLLTAAPPEGADFNDPEVLRAAKWFSDRYALVQLPSLQALVFIRSFGLSDAAEGYDDFYGFGAPVLSERGVLRGVRSATLAPVDAADLISSSAAESAPTLMDTDALRRLPSLPGTRTELRQIQRALGASESALYLDVRMTESAIRNLDLSQAQILHLATHALTSEEAGSLAEPGLVFTPPMKANASDDGYLAASEVVGIDLSSVKWVILSACNTASPSGDSGLAGLSDLARAFFYAGTESLLVSHWPVFDDIAPVITVETVKASGRGVPRAEALQSALRKVRNDPKLDAAHPSVWAPFTLVGEGR